MEKIHFTLEEARNYMVSYHFLNISSKLKGHDGIKTVFERLGSIQYDPLNVVGTNNNLVMQSRITNYNSSLMEDALYNKRYLIDGWDKQMCIYETKHFPAYKSIRDERAEKDMSGYIKYFDLDPLEFVDDILDVLRTNGPMYSQKIKLGKTIKSTWGSSKQSTATLSYLSHKGVIGIKERRNTQKKYDLIGNLIGDKAMEASPFNNEVDFIKWLVLRRIKSMGLMWTKSGVAWSGLHIGNKKVREHYIKILKEEGLIKEIKIADFDEKFYIPSDANFDKKPTKKISFIAPLDNFIWDRDLTLKLFDFHYRWEVYTPAKKREYGYYVLPILYGNRFIGRIEFEKQRKKEPLIIKNFWLDDGVKYTKKINEELMKALDRFRKYLGADRVDDFKLVEISN